MSNQEEKERQNAVPWERGKFFKMYETMLGHYIIQSVLEHAKPPNLLDIACGNGAITSQLAPHFERVVGLDASSGIVARARLAYPKIDFVDSLAEDYHPAEKFSTITVLNLLEHVIDPVGLLRSLGRFLADEGVLIVNVPNALAVNRRLAKFMGTLTDEYELSPYDINVAGHRRSYDMARLVADVEAAGLRVAKRGGIFYKSLSQAQLDWFLENGLWEAGGFGWGRVGSERAKDWRKAFCDACFELGKDRPNDCNLVYVVAHI